MPFVAVAVDGAVIMLPLDGDESLRAKEKMVDFSLPIAVAPQQCPVVAEGTLEFGFDLLLTCNPSLQYRFPCRHRSGRAGWGGVGASRRSRRTAKMNRMPCTPGWSPPRSGAGCPGQPGRSSPA